MSEFAWAVDVATSKLAFAFADLESESVEVRTLVTRTEEREGARLGLLDRQLRIYARQCVESFPPACAWVEQASGRFAKPQLHYVVGVIQAALAETLACPVWTIPSGKWKKRALGYGNATKGDVATFARAHGYEGESQDEADAFAIAIAGRDIFKTGRWDAAA